MGVLTKINGNVRLYSVLELSEKDFPVENVVIHI